MHNMEILHDSRSLDYRAPFGAVQTGEEVTLSIDVSDAEVREATLQIRSDEDAEFTSIEMEASEATDVAFTAGSQGAAGSGDKKSTQDSRCRFQAKYKVPDESCLIWYRFRIVAEDENGELTVFYCNNKEGLGGIGQVVESSEESTPYQITVYKLAEVPDWYKNGIVYQIFPDRFARDDDWRERCEDANRSINERRVDIRRIIEDDWYKPGYYVRDSAKKVVKWPIYGGSLRGIMSRLDYLKSLGVTVIYLNPIFEATSNHRYDTGNYMKIDPALGTEQDFIDLAETAHERGIRLMLDGVFSHTGADSIYFDKFGNYPQEEAAGHGNYLDDLSTADQSAEKETGPVKGAWEHEDSPFRSWYKFDKSEKWGYKSWWGVEDLPEVIEEDPGYQKYIYESVIPHWLKCGASGWRLDVADELPDSFIRGVRKAIKENDPDGALIGEVWEDASNKVSYGERRYYFAGDELDGTMNYPLRTLLLDYINYTITAGQAGDKFMSLAENYPKENLYGALNLIGSHDRKRVITMMAANRDYGAAVSKVKLLSLLEYALPGVPCIYYGDEAGLQGGADPANRSGYPWGNENSELLFHYRMLGLIYDEHPVLKDGGITMLSGKDGISDDVMAFVRGYDGPSESELAKSASADERILVLVNRSYGSTEVDLSNVKAAGCGYAIDLLTSEELKLHAEQQSNPSLGVIEMAPLSAKVILLLDEAPEKEDLGRSAGVICDLRSLGGHSLGKKARDFVDYAASAGFGVWQVLPVNPPGLGGSPYDCASAFAGDPELIDCDEVPDDEGTKACKSSPDDEGTKTCKSSPDDEGFDAFCEDNAWWLHGYAAYCVIKETLDGAPLSEWPDEYRLADTEKALRMAKETDPDMVDRILHEQYWFAAEWRALKEYANSRGVRMMGDIPMYVSSDSADVWTDMTAGEHIFRMDENGRLSVHAGVPPDYFSKDGQDWGNPLYDWVELKRSGYEWWIRRIRQCAQRFDILRIDHFRALSEYYAIPEGGKPIEGLWQHGPGADLVNAIREMLTREGLGMKLVAEDLGQLDAGVYDLLKLSGLPGMDIWQFSAYEMMAQTEEIAKQRAFYSGTHDNDTLAGFVQEHAEDIIGHAVGRGQEDVAEDKTTAGATDTDDEDEPTTGAAELSDEDKAAVESAGKDIIKKIYESPAVLAMVQLQDVFMLGSEARMNVPGLSDGNWKWKIPGDSIKDSFADADRQAAWFRKLAEDTDRI